MVIYTREKKTLIIPEGLQGGSADCKDAIAAAYSSGITVGYGQGYEAGQAECSGGTDCSSAITEAYQSGITEGINTQKSRMESITITANTAVTRTDGWNEITVNVPSSGDCSEAIAEAYQSGHTGGVNEQKAKLDSITITANTTVTREDGWSSVTVNVHSTECNLGPDVESLNSAWNGHSYFYPSSIGKDGFSEMYIYDNGYGSKKIADGMAQQKALLGSTAITENGTYTTNGNGWSSVTVNVGTSSGGPQSTFRLYAKSGSDTVESAEDTRNYTINGTPIEELNPKTRGGANYRGETFNYTQFSIYSVNVITAITFECYKREDYQTTESNTAYYNNYRFYIVLNGIELVPATITRTMSGQYNQYCTFSLTFSSNGAVYDAGASHTPQAEITFTNTDAITFGSGAYAFWIGTDYGYRTLLDGDMVVTFDNTTLAAGTHTVTIYDGYTGNGNQLVFTPSVGYFQDDVAVPLQIDTYTLKLKNN